MARTILIIEDDADTREIYRAALERRGYRVITATQGAEGVHLARRTSPDLILLDIRMPILNGWGAARYLKSDPETRNIPICAISAYDSEEEGADAAARVDFDCFLMKPISPEAIVAEIEARVGPPSPGVEDRGTGATMPLPD